MDKFSAFFSWLWWLCRQIDIKNPAALAKVCSCSDSTISRLFSCERLGCLVEVLPILIRKGVPTSPDEVRAKLNLIAYALGPKRMEKIMTAVIKAFAELPAPEKKVEKKELSQEQIEKLQTIARLIDELRDDGLF